MKPGRPINPRSKTQRALLLVATGMSMYAAARQLKISPSCLTRAMQSNQRKLAKEKS